MLSEELPLQMLKHRIVQQELHGVHSRWREHTRHPQPPKTWHRARRASCRRSRSIRSRSKPKKTVEKPPGRAFLGVGWAGEVLGAGIIGWIDAGRGHGWGRTVENVQIFIVGIVGMWIEIFEGLQRDAILPKNMLVMQNFRIMYFLNYFIFLRRLKPVFLIILRIFWALILGNP